MGAVGDPVPPLEDVYHNKLLPVAVNALDDPSRQRFTGLETDGDAGELTITAIIALGPSHPVF